MKTILNLTIDHNEVNYFMFMNAKITPLAKKEKILFFLNNSQPYLKISTGASPNRGEANQSMRKMLSQFFNIPISQIKIVKGLTSRSKIVDIPLEINEVEAFINHEEFFL